MMIRPRADPNWGLNGLAHTLARMAEAAYFFLCAPTLTASNSAALSPSDPKFAALKDLNSFQIALSFKMLAAI